MIHIKLWSKKINIFLHFLYDLGVWLFLFFMIEGVDSEVTFEGGNSQTPQVDFSGVILIFGKQNFRRKVNCSSDVTIVFLLITGNPKICNFKGPFFKDDIFRFNVSMHFLFLMYLF